MRRYKTVRDRKRENFRLIPSWGFRHVNGDPQRGGSTPSDGDDQPVTIDLHAYSKYDGDDGDEAEREADRPMRASATPRIAPKTYISL